MKMILFLFFYIIRFVSYRNVDDMIRTCSTEERLKNVHKMFVPYAEWKTTRDLGIDGIKIYKCSFRKVVMQFCTDFGCVWCASIGCRFVKMARASIAQ